MPGFFMRLIVPILGAGRPSRMENGGDRRLQDKDYLVLYFNELHMFSETSPEKSMLHHRKSNYTGITK